MFDPISIPPRNLIRDIRLLLLLPQRWIRGCSNGWSGGRIKVFCGGDETKMSLRSFIRVLFATLFYINVLCFYHHVVLLYRTLIIPLWLNKTTNHPLGKVLKRSDQLYKVQIMNYMLHASRAGVNTGVGE